MGSLAKPSGREGEKGKQHRELIGNSTEEARDPEGKRRSRKRKTRIFDIKLDTKMRKAFDTF